MQVAKQRKSESTTSSYTFTNHLWEIWYSFWWQVFAWMIWFEISAFSSIIIMNISLKYWSVLIVHWMTTQLTSKLIFGMKMKQCPLKLISYAIFYLSTNFHRIWTEIRANAKNELLHSLFMSKVVYAESADIPDLDDIKPNTFSSNKPLSKEVFQRWQLILDLYKDNNFL